MKNTFYQLALVLTFVASALVPTTDVLAGNNTGPNSTKWTDEEVAFLYEPNGKQAHHDLLAAIHYFDKKRFDAALEAITDASYLADPYNPRENALCTATVKGKSYALQALLDKGADPNFHHEFSDGSQTRLPLTCALYFQNDDAFFALVEAGADIHLDQTLRESKGLTPYSLFSAASSTPSRTAKYLLENARITENDLGVVRLKVELTRHKKDSEYGRWFLRLARLLEERGVEFTLPPQLR
ncbi:MAG: hypothetical protein CSB44_02260 [Gammaproteobacteria bacterium]|nr:MAG: hypothetical protein CSB44_02260 [Gammaproteobacteria bacterium]